jgi:multiple sugar transport system permease protein
MYATRRNALIGFLYLAPAVVFVLVFTAYPLTQMVWMSFHNWSIIEPKKWVGLANFAKAWNDRQFWTSLGFTLKYTLYITPILMIGGYVIALLVAPNTPLRKVTRAVVFVPVVIGLGVSSLLWYWLFSYDFGLVNRLLVDLGVDGASYRQRVWRIMLPLTYKTILLVTLVSVIGSLLAFDQFFLMTAGQPFNRTASSVFWIYLNSFPYLKLGYGAALSLILAVIVLACTVVQMVLTRRSHG